MLAALEWTSPLTVLGGLGGLALVAGTVTAYLRAGLAKSTIELQEKEIVALQRSQERMQQDISRANERIASMENENAYLRELATGTKVASKLEAIIAAIQVERATEHAEMKALLMPKLRKRNVASKGK